MTRATVMMMGVSRLLVLAGAVFVLLHGSALAGNDPGAGKKELQRINREMLRKKKELKRANKKEHSILADLDRLDRGVQTGKSDLAEQQKKLHEAEAALLEVETSNAQMTRELDGLKQAYRARIRALYKMSRNAAVAELLAAPGQDDPLKRFRYLALIAERDRIVIRDYGKALKELSERQTDIREKKSQLLARKRLTEAKKADLEARKQKKALLLASVREEKGLYEQTLRELEESSTNLWAMIRKSEERKAASRPAPETRPVSTARAGKNRLPWPVEGQVLTRFGMQRHPQFKTMVFRRGIEIAADEGQPVHAVGDGQVVYADWYKGYGKLMIIEHGPGYYTLYGNLSRLDLNKGDRVVAGQVIGLAGDTGSLKGSKLYFELRRNGEAQDPLLWLARR